MRTAESIPLKFRLWNYCGDSVMAMRQIAQVPFSFLKLHQERKKLALLAEVSTGAANGFDQAAGVITGRFCRGLSGDGTPEVTLLQRPPKSIRLQQIRSQRRKQSRRWGETGPREVADQDPPFGAGEYSQFGGGGTLGSGGHLLISLQGPGFRSLGGRPMDLAPSRGFNCPDLSR
ncbi:hypothetical protein HPP92_004209 [Vanilla planifolia]|uniref:Uncharacterized protein n=1 Tax=Vanilla planifolia TaxID=51239 RepID=A0A835S902_VANPL|nr:hypothetical protein HPP92_004209 [Vanilla planifolia]